MIEPNFSWLRTLFISLIAYWNSSNRSCIPKARLGFSGDSIWFVSHLDGGRCSGRQFGRIGRVQVRHGRVVVNKGNFIFQMTRRLCRLVVGIILRVSDEIFIVIIFVFGHASLSLTASLCFQMTKLVLDQHQWRRSGRIRILAIAFCLCYIQFFFGSFNLGFNFVTFVCVDTQQLLVFVEFVSQCVQVDS